MRFFRVLEIPVEYNAHFTQFSDKRGPLKETQCLRSFPVAPQAWAEPLVRAPLGWGGRLAGPGWRPGQASLVLPHVSAGHPQDLTESQERGRSFLLKGQPPAGLGERRGSGLGGESQPPG